MKIERLSKTISLPSLKSLWLEFTVQKVHLIAQDGLDSKVSLLYIAEHNERKIDRHREKNILILLLSNNLYYAIRSRYEIKKIRQFRINCRHD